MHSLQALWRSASAPYSGSDADRLGLGAALLAHNQVHRTLTPTLKVTQFFRVKWQLEVGLGSPRRERAMITGSRVLRPR